MIKCPNCSSVLGKTFVNRMKTVICPSCKTGLRLDVFPAMFRKDEDSGRGERLGSDQEAGCFFHPEKKAEVTCAACGRFICSLCNLEFNGEHLCPLCLEKGRTKRKMARLETQRTCYDSIALYVAVYPLLIFWITTISAPIAIFISIRYWKAPGSIIRRTKIRYIAAIAIASVQIFGWIMVLGNVLT